MRLVLKMEWCVIDGARLGTPAVIPQGSHEVERVPNPAGYDAPWLVIKGTMIGATEGFWRQWAGKRWGEFEVQIIEEPDPTFAVPSS